MAGTALDVVVIGSIGIDTNIYGLDEGVDLERETSFTDNLDYIGQAGGFTSRGFAQLGKATAFIGSVGGDPMGAWIRETFRQDGIDATGLFLDPNGTNRSVNLMYPDGQRKSFYDGKGHMQLIPDLEQCRNVLARTRLAHFQLPNWGRLLLPIARELGLTISCDLQDIVSLPDRYRQDFINAADILFFSSVHHTDTFAIMHELLGNHAGRIVIAGMGARGCAVCTRQGIQTFGPVVDNHPVIDSVGAGDALAVGFLSSFVLDSYSLDAAILRGQIAARYTCSQKASSAHLITSEILEQRYAQLADD